MAHAIRDWRAKDRPTILACSALKQRYREILSDGSDEVAFVFLKGSPELIAGRIGSRKGHFMPSSLLDSQFRALEEPTPDQAIIVDATQPPERIAADAVAQLRR